MIRRMPVYFSSRPFTRRNLNQVIASVRRAADMSAEQQIADLERRFGCSRIESAMQIDQTHPSIAGLLDISGLVDPDSLARSLMCCEL